MQSVSSKMYLHSLDRKTLAALKAIPGFDFVLKKFMKTFSETFFEGVNMSTKILLSPDQLPEIYNLLPPICSVLDIEEPQFYLEMNPIPNSYTYGDTKVFITITSGLVDLLSTEELKSVIAHECGHIACHHVLYYTMASILLNSGTAILGPNIFTLPLLLAFAKWQRCSELSADRAAAVYMKGSSQVENTLMRLCGGKNGVLENINKNVFMEQAKAYKDFLDDSKWNSALQYFAVALKDHPFAATRALEIRQWTESTDFTKIIQHMNSEENKANKKYCSSCGCEVESDFKFCKSCGTKQK